MFQFIFLAKHYFQKEMLFLLSTSLKMLSQLHQYFYLLHQYRHLSSIFTIYSHQFYLLLLSDFQVILLSKLNFACNSFHILFDFSLQFICIQDTYHLFQKFFPLFHLDFCNLQLVTDGLISVYYETVYCMFSDCLGFTIEYIYQHHLLFFIDHLFQFHINFEVSFKAFKIPYYFNQGFLHQLKII